MTGLIASVHSVLASTPARWSALATIDPDLLARPPAPGEWSAVRCLRHLVATEHGIFRARVLAILDGRDFAAYDPEAGEGERVEQPAAELADALAPMRAVSLRTLAGLTEGDLDRTARHAELGVVSLRELLSHWAAHDTMHLVQAERAVMQAFIPGTGPWRSYFADHDVDVVGAPR